MQAIWKLFNLPEQHIATQNPQAYVNAESFPECRVAWYLQHSF
jgi:hypothetical protein